MDNTLLSDALSKRDVVMLQALIIAQIGRDRRLKEFKTKSYIEYIENLINKVGETPYAIDDEVVSLPPQEDWNHELWSDICISLEYCFTKEKIDFLVKIMTFLRNEGHPEYQIVYANQNSEVHEKNAKSSRMKRMMSYLSKARKINRGNQ